MPVVDFLAQGGPLMLALLGISIGMLVCIVKQVRFWSGFLKKQQRIAHTVLEAARSDLAKAAAIAQQGQNLPLGRFLYAPLQLQQPTPEMFRLAMEAAADKEFIEMRKGNKQLEMVATIAPLFGLLGAAVVVIRAFSSPEIGSLSGVTAQQSVQLIKQAMIPIAVSINIEIIALTFLRIFGNLQTGQAELFSEVGTRLELYYREFWQAAQRRERVKSMHENSVPSNLHP